MVGMKLNFAQKCLTRLSHLLDEQNSAIRLRKMWQVTRTEHDIINMKHINVNALSILGFLNPEKMQSPNFTCPSRLIDQKVTERNQS